MSIGSVLFSLVSENDSKSLCPIRLFAAMISIPAVLFFTIGFGIQICQGHFDLQSMATAFTTLTGGYTALGISVAMKMKNEVQ
jgi:hypothetical protein